MSGHRLSVPSRSTHSAVRATTATTRTQKKIAYASRIKDILIVVLVVFHFMRGLPKFPSPSQHQRYDEQQAPMEHYILDKRTHSSHQQQHQRYEPAPMEQYILDNSQRLGYTARESSVCDIWTDATLTTPSIHKSMTQFVSDLDQYRDLVSKFNGSVVQDVRVSLTNEVCSSLEIHPEGMLGIFKSGQLSKGMKGQGYIEPLLPPLRHPKFCIINQTTSLMDMSYLVLDFASMCRGLKPTSRIILLDMGASLDFHSGLGLRPAVYLAEIFKLFGMPFDHIYAFESSRRAPAKVYNLVPDHLMTAFHWINVGVEASPESKLNPLTSIIKKFHEDDLVVVKLDIDTPSVENPLVEQLRNDTDLLRLVDHFFFEHHINVREMHRHWGRPEGTLDETLNLFQLIRRAGPAAHYWV